MCRPHCAPPCASPHYCPAPSPGRGSGGMCWGAARAAGRLRPRKALRTAPADGTARVGPDGSPTECKANGPAHTGLGTQAPPPPPEGSITVGGGGGPGTQKCVYQNWPNQIFPTVNSGLSHEDPFGGGGRGGGGIRRGGRGRGRGRGSLGVYQKCVFHKWPHQIFPKANFAFSHEGPFGVRGRGLGGGRLARGHGVGLLAFGGACWPLTTAHPDPLFWLCQRSPWRVVWGEGGVRGGTPPPCPPAVYGHSTTSLGPVPSIHPPGGGGHLAHDALADHSVNPRRELAHCPPRGRGCCRCRGRVVQDVAERLAAQHHDDPNRQPFVRRGPDSGRLPAQKKERPGRGTNAGEHVR